MKSWSIEAFLRKDRPVVLVGKDAKPMPFAGKFPTRVFWDVTYQLQREPYSAEPKRLQYCGLPDYRQLWRMFWATDERPLRFTIGEFDRGGVFYLHVGNRGNAYKYRQNLWQTYHPFIELASCLGYLVSRHDDKPCLPFVHTTKHSGAARPFYHPEERLRPSVANAYHQLYTQLWTPPAVPVAPKEVGYKFTVTAMPPPQLDFIEQVRQAARNQAAPMDAAERARLLAIHPRPVRRPGESAADFENRCDRMAGRRRAAEIARRRGNR